MGIIAATLDQIATRLEDRLAGGEPAKPLIYEAVDDLRYIAAALPLRDTPAIGYCADCLRGSPCPDHAQEITLADQYELTGGLT
jgi:hypothetical protein